MSFIPIYRKSSHLDVNLTTADESIETLIDEILDEIADIKDITKIYRAREALKKVVLNLIRNIKTKEQLRIPRDKSRYTNKKLLYGKLGITHKWLVEIAVDGLIELGYVEYLKGSWNKEEKRGYQSKIEASDKFLEKMYNIRLLQKSISIERTPPEEIIQLKDDKKNPIKHSWDRSKIKMKDRLEQYNNFIGEQYITVNLTEAVWLDNEFLINNLLRGLLNGKYALVELILNEEIPPVDAMVNKSYSIIQVGKASANPKYILYPHNTSNSSSSTFTSSTSPIYTNTSNILYPNIITSTLTSHILNLIHLSSTQDISSRHLSNKAIMNCNEQLLDYFLNWLYFLNTDIRRGKIDEEIKWLFRKKRNLGQLGMSELIFRLKYQSLHRVFNYNKSLNKGGRFYGSAHLDIPGHMRGFIKINGEPVIELDYDALHVFMLYHLRKIDIDITVDPYDKIEGPEDRAIKKTVLLTAINAKTGEKAIKGIRKKLVDDGIKGDVLTDVSIKSLLNRAKSAHPDIADDIGSGKGIILQNYDSKIADAILTNLMIENIPAQPVHDSFVVPGQYEDLLRQQMIDEYEKVMKFKPGVSKKKKRLYPKKWDNLNSKYKPWKE